MLHCTTLRSVSPVDSGRRTFFWSEIVTLNVTIAYNPAAGSAYKTELHTQHGGATAAEAWTRAAMKVCEAALVSTSVTTAVVSASASVNSSSAANNSQLTRPPSSSSVMMGTRQRQQVEPALVEASGSESPPSVTFTVTFSIPYSSSAATAPATEQQDKESSKNEQPTTTGMMMANAYLCEWEVLLLIGSTSGPARASMQHCDVFGLLRHSVQVSSALLISSRTVGCGTCSSNPISAMMRPQQISPGNTPAKLLLRGGAQSPGGMTVDGSTAASHRVIAVQCRNCCEHHVNIQHVELENLMWAAASVLHQQTSKAAQAAISGGGGGAGGGGNGSNSGIGSSPASSAVASVPVSASNPWIVRQRVGGDDIDSNILGTQQQAQLAPPQLMALSDPLPITLKPSECYTFCFQYHHQQQQQQQQHVRNVDHHDDHAAERLQLVVRTTIASRPVLINHTLKL